VVFGDAYVLEDVSADEEEDIPMLRGGD